MKLIKSFLTYPTAFSSDEVNNVYLFTNNTTVNANGELIMGGGNALAFAKAYPSSPKTFGKLVKKYHNTNVIIIKHMGGTGNYVGCFKTKTDPRLPSDIKDVIQSINELKSDAKKAPEMTFHLPYPAVGLGGLTVEQLKPYMDFLPDNVHVYLV